MTSTHRQVESQGAIGKQITVQVAQAEVSEEQFKASVAKEFESLKDDYEDGIGRLAYMYHERGYTDQQFADDFGLKQQDVNIQRRIYERFRFTDFSVKVPRSHKIKALPWDDAEHWLQLAAQHGWTLAQMRFARSEAQLEKGEPLDEAKADFPEDEPIIEPDVESVPESRRDIAPSRQLDPDPPSREFIPTHRVIKEESQQKVDHEHVGKVCTPVVNRASKSTLRACEPEAYRSLR